LRLGTEWSALQTPLPHELFEISRLRRARLVHPTHLSKEVLPSTPTRPVQRDLLDPRTPFATYTPGGAHDHTGVLERVIEMDGDSPEVDAANAGNGD
jgi:hypothetical protein